MRDLDEAVDLYATLFDTRPRRADEDSGLAACRATLDVRGLTIELLAPDGEGPVRRALDEDGEGPLEITIQVEDPTAVAEALARTGIEPEDASGRKLRIPTGAALGARLIFAPPR